MVKKILFSLVITLVCINATFTNAQNADAQIQELDSVTPIGPKCPPGFPPAETKKKSRRSKKTGKGKKESKPDSKRKEQKKKSRKAVVTQEDKPVATVQAAPEEKPASLEAPQKEKPATIAAPKPAHPTFLEKEVRPVPELTAVKKAESTKSEPVTQPRTPEKTAQPAKPSAEQSAERVVMMKNDITEKMLGYKYLFMTYRPEFKISVNGKEIPQGATVPCTIKDNFFVARYDYNFMNGHRVGSDEVHFAMDPKAETASITFAWKSEIRIMIDNAIPCGERVKLKK